MYHIKAFCTLIVIFLTVLTVTAADSATAVMQLVMPEYTKIEPVTSPVLTANITDRTGNLYTPLYAKFKVTTNVVEKTLYLKANAVTDAGYEDAMFTQDGRVYIAFTNISEAPSSASLFNCKTNALPKDSPGVVAYPVISVTGAHSEYNTANNKYELTVKNGITNINVNVGSHVLRSSFASNDHKGFYQAVLSLTETDT